MSAVIKGLRVRPGLKKWEILCPPGELAQLFSRLSSVQAGSKSEEVVDGQPMAVIPVTSELDKEIEKLVDTLITLRYETGRVQLELFSREEI